jgi:hypothetical protein
MADENTTEQSAAERAEETPPEGSVAVEIEKERGGRPALSDEDLGKLTEIPEDEIARANESAKKAVKSLRAAYHEQRRRAEVWSRDASTASNLAEQLYRENQQLRQNVNRSEVALVEQALGRAQAQLEGAKTKAKQALISGDPDLIVAANEDVSRAVAEVDRLKVIQPAVTAERDRPSGEEERRSPQQPQQPPPASERTRNFIAANPWFGKDQEMTQFALRQHEHLRLDGITEESNPDLYWREIESKLKETYPEKFGSARPTEGRARPPAVTGSPRSNGASTPSANGKRVVHLTESQIRLAGRLGVTPEQYAVSLVKQEQDEERDRDRRRLQ